MLEDMNEEKSGDIGMIINKGLKCLLQLKCGVDIKKINIRKITLAIYD